MNTTTPLSVQKILVILCFFVLANTYGQDQNPTNKMLFGKPVKAENINPNTGGIRCATTEYEEFLQKKNPKRMTDAQFEAWLTPLVKKHKTMRTASKTAATIITIPVVVHVIHSGQAVGSAPNISDAQVQSQITVLNEDFRKMLGSPGYNTNPVGADIEIEFKLALQDPNGNPTNGIDRVNLCQNTWPIDDIDTYVKPVTIWDPSQYLNMWSVSFSNSNDLGYAQYPDGSGLDGLDSNGGNANTDGVVSNFSVFGSIAYNDGSFVLDGTFNKGRTMTHEVGHWLGLRHIWGDATCGDDFCADTPIHHDKNFGCPQPIPSSCDPVPAPEMIQNYMDYTDDACMNIFTLNQKDRIRVIMDNASRRVSLKTSTKATPIALVANDVEIKIDAGNCVNNTQNAECIPPPSSNKQVVITNRGTATLTAATLNYTINGGGNQVHTWNGSLAQNKSATVTLLNTNVYGTLNVNVATANGGADQRIGNNNSTATFNVPSSPENYNFNTFTFRLQRDKWGAETTWSINDSSGVPVYSGGPYTNTTTTPSLIIQNWTLSNNQCYSFTINDAQGDGICCGTENGDGYFNIKSTDGTIEILSGSNFGYTSVKSFSTNLLSTNEFETSNEIYLYPNPTKGTLNIRIPNNFGLPNSYAISNVLGQKISQKEISKETDLSINTSALSNGIYFITIAKEGQKRTLRFIKE